MSTNVSNRAPYLRTTRNYPEDIKQLTVELNKDHTDIAQNLNDRTIGIFTVNLASINGENWFLGQHQNQLINTRQQGLRQVYKITSVSSALNHGIQLPNNQLVRAFGNYTDNTNFYGFIWGSTTAITGQISFYVTNTQIVFVPDAGAPTFQSGIIVLEWISPP